MFRLSLATGTRTWARRNASGWSTRRTGCWRRCSTTWSASWSCWAWSRRRSGGKFGVCSANLTSASFTRKRFSCSSSKSTNWWAFYSCKLQEWPRGFENCAYAHAVISKWYLDQPLSCHTTPDHLFLDSAPNLGPLISRWEINKFENCWYISVRILEVLKIWFQQFLNLSSSQRDMSGPVLGALSNNRWSWGSYTDGLNL